MLVMYLLRLYNGEPLYETIGRIGTPGLCIFGESKRSLKSCSDEHKRSVRNYDCDKNKVAKHCWEADHNFSWVQKKVINRESRLIPRKIKETIHSLKNPNHINKISYTLPEIWHPNLR